MDGQRFVTRTTIIDIRNGDIIQAGDPFPKEAMHEHSFAKFSRKGTVLPYTETNRLALNPRLSRRREVLGLNEPVRNNPKNIRELVHIEDPDTDPKAADPGPRKLVLPVAGTEDDGQRTPPVFSSVKQDKSPKKAKETAIANIWTFDPVQLAVHQMPVLQQSMVQRCGEFGLDVPTIVDRDELIAFMSKDYIAL